MEYFSYKGSELYVEDVALSSIAEKVGTPVYVYSTAALQQNYLTFRNSFGDLDVLVCFAVKANSNQAVLATLAAIGAGADVVSGGELKRALAAGIPADKIVFSGVAKSREEMHIALEAGICQFNIESVPELLLLNEVALDMGRVAPVSVRVNPDIDANTHAKISTGKAEDKFGIAWQDVQGVYARIKELPGVTSVGIDIHIGSQLTSLDPFAKAFSRVAAMVKNLREAGHTIENLDLGGGLGISYDNLADDLPTPQSYGKIVQDSVKGLKCKVIFEPGRLIAGNAGVLISKVQYVKQGTDRTFVIVDAGMNDLMRPALYDAYHAISPVVEPSPSSDFVHADFVGPVCESADTFAKGRKTARLNAGDLIAFHSAGAYGAVMSNTYNSRPLVAEVLVKGSSMAVVRKRDTVTELIARDTVPDWIDIKS